jgi:hypothetical protein
VLVRGFVIGFSIAAPVGPIGSCASGERFPMGEPSGWRWGAAPPLPTPSTAPSLGSG